MCVCGGGGVGCVCMCPSCALNSRQLPRMPTSLVPWTKEKTKQNKTKQNKNTAGARGGHVSLQLTDCTAHHAWWHRACTLTTSLSDANDCISAAACPDESCGFETNKAQQANQSMKRGGSQGSQGTTVMIAPCAECVYMCVCASVLTASLRNVS